MLWVYRLEKLDCIGNKSPVRDFKAVIVERLLLFLSTKPQHVVDKRSETDLFDNSLFDNSVKQQLQLALN